MSFLPLENPIGFGASDFIELALAACLILLILFWRPVIEPFAAVFAQHTVRSMLFLAALPIALRLVLLPHHPIPSPDIYDEFGHLLVADTLLHFRLANPPHPLHQFFETFFILQQPTYSSIYPIGQGLALAAGKLIFATPWAGVVLSTSAFCSLCYWMLRGWTTPTWSLLGGLLAVFEFGPLSQWMNTYWGGSLAAAGGCLVFGALPRLRAEPNVSNAALLSLGLSINILTRPYESTFLALSAIFFFHPALSRALIKPLLVTVLLLIPAIGITALQNRRVTGNWTTLPYTLSQYQYGVPASLTFQAKPVPHGDLTPQQRLEYQTQLAFQATPETLQSYLLRLEYRVRFYRFFFLPPLLLTLPFFLPALRQYRFAWVAATLLLFALGINFFPAFQFHYLAAITCLFVLVSITGLEQIDRISTEAARYIIYLCVAYFAFWYTLHIFDTREFSQSIRQYETWTALNHRNPDRRIQVNQDLAEIPGTLLIFVHYSPQHIFQDEWVYNAADIDNARIVFARDLGPIENAKLRTYYPDRSVYVLEPDFPEPRLTSW